jgi:ribosomal protein S18 acetylase RimI-like enzyme
MKFMLIRFVSIILALFLGNGLRASSLKTESIKAPYVTHELWQALDNLWLTSFFNIYIKLPLRSIDSEIQEESEEALIDYLKRRFTKYQSLAIQNSYVFTLIYKEESLVGYTLHHELPQASIIEIDHFAVDPSCQGQGIGKALLEAIIKSNPEVKSIVLSTRILNIPAREFYKKLGFYEIEHMENVKFNPSYSILLKKDILNLQEGNTK